MTSELPPLSSTSAYTSTNEARLSAADSAAKKADKPTVIQQQDARFSKPQLLATVLQGQQADKLVANPLQQTSVDQKKDEQEEVAVGPLDADELRSLLDEVNSTLYSMNRALRFELHDQTEEVVVRVVNTKTDEVVRQYPSEEVLARRARLIEGDTSFFNTQVD